MEATLYTKLALQAVALNVCFCYASAPESGNEKQLSSEGKVESPVTHQIDNDSSAPRCGRFSQNQIVVLTKNGEGKHLYHFDPTASSASVEYLGGITLPPRFRTTIQQYNLKYIKDIALDSEGCLFALGKTYRLGTRGETYVYQLDDMTFEAHPKGMVDDRYGLTIIFSGYNGEALTGGSYGSPFLSLKGFNVNDLSLDKAIKAKRSISLDIPSNQRIVSMVRPMTYDFMLYSIVYKPPMSTGDGEKTPATSALYKMTCRQEGESSSDMVSEKVFEVPNPNVKPNILHGLAVYMDDVYMGIEDAILKINSGSAEPEFVVRVPNGYRITGMASRHYLANTAAISPEAENSGWTCSTGGDEE